MRAIGGLLNDVDNAISLAVTPTPCNTRAARGLLELGAIGRSRQCSRRELVAGGMKENKILRVVGLGSSLPLDPEDPLNPMNRRISLVVLNDKTERQIRGLPEEPIEEIQNEADAAQVLGLGEAPAEVPGGTEPAPAAEPDLRRRTQLPPASGSRSRKPAAIPRERRARSTAASDAFPLAPLLLAAEGCAVERHIGAGRVMSAPVSEIALVGVVSRQLAEHSPDALQRESHRANPRPAAWARAASRRAADSGGPTMTRGRCAPSRRPAPTRSRGRTTSMRHPGDR